MQTLKQFIHGKAQYLGLWFDACWLPVFLLLSTTWLFAPALHHVHYGQLSVISAYESIGQPWAWLFRLGDVLGALVLLTALWRYRVVGRDRIIGLSLLAIGVLSAVDSLFPHACTAVCTPVQRLSGMVHDGESAVLAVVVALSATVVLRRSRHWLAVLFLGAQLLVGLLAVVGLLSHAQLMSIQYIYETAIVAWAAWLLSAFAPRLQLSREAQALVRRLFGWLTLASGVLVLVFAVMHRHFGGAFFGELAEEVGSMPWLPQHDVIAGLLLLYIARHVGKGQRRAALLLAVILLWLTFLYALYQPKPVLVGLCLLLLALLWRFGSSFGRNVGPVLMASRLKDFAVVLVGVLLAASLVLGLAVATGRQHVLYREISRAYQHSETKLPRRHDRLSEHVERDIRRTSGVLAVGLLVLLAWTLFRPSGKPQDPPHSVDRSRAEMLLRRYSNSSEDFFKLWPTDKKYFFGSAVEGFVAYKVVRSVAFALADPIAKQSDSPQLLQEFADYCRANGWHACFLLVQDMSKSLYENNFRLFRIGSSAVINVEEFATVTSREKWWRWQANRAQRLGLTYEVRRPPHDNLLLRESRRVSEAWLARAGRSEQGFALGYFDKGYLQRCVLHTLRDSSGKLVAFANEVPTFANGTQRTVDLIRFVPDVDGAMSMLLLHTLISMHETEHAATFDLGFVPLAKLDSTLAAIARRLGAGRFSAAGLEQFKGKFRPMWRANYLAYDGDVIDLVVVLAALERALAKE